MNIIRRFVISLAALALLATPLLAAEEGAASTLPKIAIGMTVAALLFLAIGVVAGYLTSRESH